MSGTLGDLGQLGDGSMQMGFGGGASDPYMMELMRRRAMADALAKQGMAEAQRPMTHWLQPLGSIVQQGVAAWRQGKADDELLNYAKGQAVADQEARRNIMAMLLGGGQGATPTPAPQPQPVAPSQGAAPTGGAQAPAPAMPANYGPTQAKAAFEYFTGQGFTPQQSAAMVANIKHESNFNPTLTHDGGIGYGVLGWNGPRLAAMRAKYGDTPTFQQQLEFMRDEVRNGTDAGMGKWGAINSNDAGALGADLSSIGVRPRDVDLNRQLRAATAQQYYQQFTGAQPNVNVSAATTAPAPSAPPQAAPTAAGGPLMLDKNRMLAAALAAGLSGRPGVAPLGTMLAGVARALPETWTPDTINGVNVQRSSAGKFEGMPQGPNWQTVNVGQRVLAFNPQDPTQTRDLGANVSAPPGLMSPEVAAQQLEQNRAKGSQTVINNGQSTAQELTQKAYQAAQDASVAASRRQAYYGQILKKFQNFDTGPTAGARITMGQIARDVFGAKVDGLSEAEAGQMLLQRLQTDMSKGRGEGQVSNFERDLFRSALPQLGLTPEGLRTAIQVANELDQMDIDAAKVWRTNAGRNPNRLPDPISIYDDLEKTTGQRSAQVRELLAPYLPNEAQTGQGAPSAPGNDLREGRTGTLNGRKIIVRNGQVVDAETGKPMQ